MTAPDFLTYATRRYVPEAAPPPAGLVRARVRWDDEVAELNFKCRTQDPGFVGPDNPPAVWRFYPEPIPDMGDFRVRMSTPYDWKPQIITLNGGGREGEHRWEFLTDNSRATYNNDAGGANNSGWDKQMYVTMSGNTLLGTFEGNWFRFLTLKPSDLGKVAGMTQASHPHYVQFFSCVTWRRGDDGVFYTHRIPHTGTARGTVLWYLVSKEGVAWIPARHVVRL